MTKHFITCCLSMLRQCSLGMAAGALFSSCATIFSGTEAKITIDGEVDEPVTVVTSRGEYRDLLLPVTLPVKRRHIDGQHIRITSQHYAYKDIVLQKSISPWAWVSTYFGLPLVVDLLTNAVSEPKQKQFFIRPAADAQAADSLYRADSLRLVALAEQQRRIKRHPEHHKSHELSLGLGFGANQADHDMHRMVDGYEQRYYIREFSDFENLIGDAYLSANIEYHYRLNRRWAVGALLGVGLSRETYYGEYATSELVGRPITPYLEYRDGEEKCWYMAVAPSLRLKWYETNACQVYSRIALGALYQHLSFDYRVFPCTDWYHVPEVPSYTESTDRVKWRMAYQLTPIGFNMGSDAFHLFGELGYGCLGVVRLGFSYSF